METTIHLTLLADLAVKLASFTILIMIIIWLINTMRLDVRYNRAKEKELENIREEAKRIKHLADVCEKAKEQGLI